MEPTKVFNRAFVGLTLFLTLFYTFNLGVDAANSDGKEAIVDGVLAGFWLLSFALFSLMNRQSAKADNEFKQVMAEIDKGHAKIMAELEEAAREERHAREMLDAIAKDVIGKRKPKAGDAAKIEKAFHENMEDHWCKLTFDKKSGKFDVVIQKQPFETATPKRATKSTVVKTPSNTPAQTVKNPKKVVSNIKKTKAGKAGK